MEQVMRSTLHLRDKHCASVWTRTSPFHGLELDALVVGTILGRYTLGLYFGFRWLNPHSGNALVRSFVRPCKFLYVGSDSLGALPASYLYFLVFPPSLILYALFLSIPPILSFNSCGHLYIYISGSSIHKRICYLRKSAVVGSNEWLHHRMCPNIRNVTSLRT